MKKIVSNAFITYIALVISTLSFTACSGGGGGGGGGSSTRTVTALSDKVLTGTGVDGYIDGGTACLDLNLNSACDTGEPTATTDSQGEFLLDVQPVHQLHDNYLIAPVIVIGGRDIDTGKAFIGIMKAPFYGNERGIVVSPLTTMVQAIVDSGKTEEEAIEAVAGALGLNKDDVLKDPVALFDAKPEVAKATLAIQKSVELLTQANITNSGESLSIVDAFNTVYEQLSNATISVAEDLDANKSFATIVSVAAEDGNLTGAAADLADVVNIIVTNIDDSDPTLELEELAVLNDEIVDDVTDLIITSIENNETLDLASIETVVDDAETNPRALQIIQILNNINATDTQIDAVMALTTIETLVDDTVTITEENVATAIEDSGDQTLLDLVAKLTGEDGSTETPCDINPITGLCEDGTTLPVTATPCEDVNPITGLCEDGTTPPVTATPCENVNPITGDCEDTTTPPVTATPCENVNPITGDCEDTTTPPVTATPCENVNPITGDCEDTTTPPVTATPCENVNPITGDCEDTTTPTETPTPTETETPCANVNPITGLCED